MSERDAHEAACQFCQVVRKALEAVMKEVVERTEAGEEGEVARHFLGAACQWWVRSAMATTQGDVTEMMACLAHVMAEHGIRVGVALPVEDEESVSGPH